MTDPTTPRPPSGARPRTAGRLYRITVQGELDDGWSAWFDGLVVSADVDGHTALVGVVRDQAALHGLLAKIRDLGLTLIAVEPRSKGPVR